EPLQAPQLKTEDSTCSNPAPQLARRCLLLQRIRLACWSDRCSPSAQAGHKLEPNAPRLCSQQPTSRPLTDWLLQHSESRRWGPYPRPDQGAVTECLWRLSDDRL